MANLNPHMGILTWVLRDGCLMDCATVVPGLKPRPSGQSRLTETLQNTQKNTQSITCLALSVNRTASPPFNWKFTGVAATATTKKNPQPSEPFIAISSRHLFQAWHFFSLRAFSKLRPPCWGSLCASARASRSLTHHSSNQFVGFRGTAGDKKGKKTPTHLGKKTTAKYVYPSCVKNNCAPLKFVPNSHLAPSVWGFVSNRKQEGTEFGSEDGNLRDTSDVWLVAWICWHTFSGNPERWK